MECKSDLHGGRGLGARALTLILLPATLEEHGESSPCCAIDSSPAVGPCLLTAAFA